MNQIATLLLTCGCLWVVNVASGQNWNQTSSPSKIWMSIASSADGTKLVAGANGIYVSSDSGITWAMTTAPVNVGGWGAIASSADGTKLIAAGRGPIYTSVDSGITWVSNNVPSERWSSVASSADGKKLVAVSFYNGTGVSPPPGEIYASTNGGDTWTIQTNAPNNNWLSVVSSTDGNKLAAINSFTFYTSTNSGVTWVERNPPLIGWNSSIPSQILASSGDGNRLVLGFASINGFYKNLSPIYISTNSGVTWIQSSAPSNNWTSVASSVDGSKLMASVGGLKPNSTPITGPIFTSTDLGATWKSNDVDTLDWAAVAMSADGNKLIADPGEYSFGPVYASYSIPTNWLNIAPTHGGLMLSWTIPSTNFVLQQSSNLASWLNVTEPPTLNLITLQDEVILSAPHGNSFYRLKTP